MKIHIGTICRNIEAQFPQLYKFIHSLSNHNVRFCIYENNSSDNTKQYLNYLKELHQDITIKSEDIPVEKQLGACKARTWDNKPCRMELIAEARNKLCEMLEVEEYCENDLVLLFDADMVDLPTGLTEIIYSFPSDADAIFANGLTGGGNSYYDMYALRSASLQPFGPEIIGEQFWNQMLQMQLSQRLSVYTAFGGLAIYRAKAIRGLRYSAEVTPELNQYNKYISQRVAFDFKKPENTHYQGILLGIYLYGDDGPFYWNNSGYNYPIVCEHSAFHAAMWARGHGRFFIEPSLKYYSGH